MKLALGKSLLLTPKTLLFGLSFIAMVICAWAAAAHYRKLAWGDPWQPIGWLLSMFFLLCAFLPDSRGLATGFRSLLKPKTAFFLFWILLSMRKAHSNPMGLSQWKSRLSIAKILLFSLSVVSLLIGAGGATSHYLGWSWGNRAHPSGWLLSMLFLLLAFAPSPRESARWLKSLIRPRTAFFLFWILFFIVSHLWNFRTSPWNGNALFDESGWDLYF